ncbi:hypothetical protein DFP93_1079 [Aneurinibacillus soli]|uniref:Uncharacterized protein n=1 Tax=Aneurinibacillus soli TaxID=1500254 RepID=A0A0U5AXQ8_9BACL|nr:hypothetical protein [Aneurinibacillus soli]PYE61620.1 hypothetical protein DFP93_1079 [Aneurinibacillus soli]BAU28522.1 hypothetical protein CB4_02696 [Aneurinibacillus soli]
MNAVQVRKSETKGILKALLFISVLWSMLALATKAEIITPSIEKSPEQKHVNLYEARANSANVWAEQMKVNVK